MMQALIDWVARDSTAAVIDSILLISGPFLLAFLFIGWYFKRPLYYKFMSWEYNEYVLYTQMWTFVMGYIFSLINLNDDKHINFMIGVYITFGLPTLLFIPARITWQKMMKIRDKIPEA